MATIEAALFFSFLLFMILGVIDLGQIISAQLRLASALNTSAIYATTGYTFQAGDTFPDMPQVVVAEKAAGAGIRAQAQYSRCYACYDASSETAACVDAPAACHGQLLYAYSTVTAHKNVALPLYFPGLAFAFPGLAFAFPANQTVYYPVLVSDQP